MLERVLEFNRALRNAGIPVAATESADALRALESIRLTDRESFRAALACTTIKNESHRDAFDVLFDLYFSTGQSPEDAGSETAPLDDRDLIDAIGSAIGSGAGGGSDYELARQAVERFGRLDGSASKDWYSHYQVMRAIDLDSLVRRLVDEVGASEDTPLEKRLRRSEIEDRARRFREATLTETRRRVAQQRGADAVAQYAVSPLPEEADFFGLMTDVDEMRKAIRPLARKLATRIAMKRRRASRGQLDVRRTIRHSLAYGGVPMATHLKRRVPHRPELFILCDVSGSVGRFSRFTLMLTHALSTQFSRVRSFAFIDHIDEVTRHFEHEDFLVAIERMNEQADVVRFDGHSDYGSCLAEFERTYGADVGPKTTLLILGDARNNYRGRAEGSLMALHRRARHTYWLNPEPRRDWDVGDSVASEYATHVDEMVEVRNLRHLERFITHIL